MIRFVTKNVLHVALAAGALLGATLHSSDASATWRFCPAIGNVTFVDNAGGDNIEVLCNTPYTTGIDWAGFLTSNAADSERFLSIALAALLSGKGFSVDMGGTGCPGATSNCRLVTSFGVYNP